MVLHQVILVIIIFIVLVFIRFNTGQEPTFQDLHFSALRLQQSIIEVRVTKFPGTISTLCNELLDRVDLL
jgi:hypothetical protein